jgi:hypothetical protein
MSTNKQPSRYSRARFLKTAGAFTAGGIFLPLAGCSDTPSEPEFNRPPEKNYISGAIELKDVFSGESIPSGHVTFPNAKTIEIRDGIAQFDASEELSAGYARLVIESDSHDFPTSSYVVNLQDESVSELEILPYRFEAFDYDEFIEYFCHERDQNIVTRRFRDNLDIVSYHYDQQYLKGWGDDRRLVHSSDPSLLSSQGFVEDSVASYKQINQWLPKKAGITVETRIESESDEVFPEFDTSLTGVILNAGGPDIPHLLTQSYFFNGSVLNWAMLYQTTGTPSGPAFESANPGATISRCCRKFWCAERQVTKKVF